MFNPFQMIPQESRSEERPIYSKHLGWSEYDEEGDSVPATIVVVKAFVGYDIFRVGEQIYHLDWYGPKECAIEWAVDRVRQEVAEHEMRQAERD